MSVSGHECPETDSIALERERDPDRGNLDRAAPVRRRWDDKQPARAENREPQEEFAVGRAAVHRITSPPSRIDRAECFSTMRANRAAQARAGCGRHARWAAACCGWAWARPGPSAANISDEPQTSVLAITTTVRPRPIEDLLIAVLPKFNAPMNGDAGMVAACVPSAEERRKFAVFHAIVTVVG